MALSPRPPLSSVTYGGDRRSPQAASLQLHDALHTRLQARPRRPVIPESWLRDRVLPRPPGEDFSHHVHLQRPISPVIVSPMWTLRKPLERLAGHRCKTILKTFAPRMSKPASSKVSPPGLRSPIWTSTETPHPNQGPNTSPLGLVHPPSLTPHPQPLLLCYSSYSNFFTCCTRASASVFNRSNYQKTHFAISPEQHRPSFPPCQPAVGNGTGLISPPPHVRADESNFVLNCL